MRTRHIAAAALAAGALLIPAGAASASGLPGLPSLSHFTVPVSATATTLITNHLDGGHGNPADWATETIWRTETVTRGAEVSGTDCGLAASADCWAYTASLSDSGSFTTIPGAGTPNQACAGCAGEHIARQVSGALQGTYVVTFDASSGSPDGTLVGPTRDDHDTHPAPPFTTTTWGEQFFPAGTSFGNVTGGAYSWTYTVAFPREQWVDASANGDGNQPGDGNISG